MSRTIDQKVVEMRFDNSDFERNVSHSMSTLDKLKNALNFSGVEKSFSGITSAADKVDFKGLHGAIDDTGHKFSALEAIATGAFMRIGASISDYVMGKLSETIGLVKSISFDQFSAGMDKYGKKTTAVQTIMNATGREIDDVSEKLATLNWFTDETSYDFVDMVNNIGKFTSQGIELEDAVSAMEGISTAAALAGQNAQTASRVMYNFSQALGMGSVKVQDWMSVENANMATQEFKQTIIDTAIELGRLDKMGNILVDVGGNYSGDHFVNVGNFRSTLAANWFDSEVLIEAMNKFGGFAGRLNEVYDQFNENYDVTTSQILGWLNEFEQGTLDINEVIKKTGLTADEILPVLQELSSEEYELGRRAFAAAQEAKTFEDVINATKDAVSTAWMNVFENIFGNYEEAKVMWTQLSNELWDIFAGPVSNLNDLLTDWHDMGGRDAFIDSIKNMYQAVRSYLDPIVEAWASVFPSMTAERLVELTKRFESFTAGLKAGEDRMEKIHSTFEGFFGVVKRVGGILREIGGVIGFLIKEAFDLVSVFASNAFSRNGGFFSGLSDALDWVSGKIHDFRLALTRVRSVIDEFESAKFAGVIDNYQKGYPVIYKFIGALDKLKSVFADLGSLAAKNLDFSNWDLYFGEAGGGIAGVANVVYYLLKNILDTTGNIVHTISGIDIHDQIDSIKEYLHDWAYLFELLQKSGWFDKLKKEFLGVFDAFDTRFGSIASWFKPLKDAIESIAQDFVEGIGMIFGNQDQISLSFLAEGVVGLRKFVEESKTLGFIIEIIKSAIEVFSEFASNFLSLSNTVRVFQEAGGGLAGLLAVIRDKLHNVTDLIADVIQKITGIDLHWLSDLSSSVFGVVTSVVTKAADAAKYFFGLFKKDKTKDFEDFSGDTERRLTPLRTLLDGLKSLLGGVKTAFDRLKPIIGAVLTKLGAALGVVGTSLKDAFSNADIGKILDLVGKGLKIAFGTGVVRLVNSLRKPLDGLSDIFDGVKDILDGVKGCLEAWQKDLQAKTLLKIASAIGIIAIAVIALSGVDPEKLGVALGAITVLFLELIGAMAGVSKMPGNKKAFSGVGTTLLALSVSLLIASSAFKKIGDMDWDSVRKGAVGMGAVIGELVAALNLMPKDKAKGGFTMIEMGLSLLMVASVLKKIGDMSWDGILKGLTGMGVALLEMAGAMLIINRFAGGTKGGFAMIEMALSLLMVASVLKKIGDMSWDGILKGLTGMGVALLEMALAMKLMPSGGKSILVAAGLIALAAALLLLTPSLILLGKMPLAGIGKSLLMLAGVFTLIGVAVHVLGPMTPMLIALSAAIALLGVSILAVGAGLTLFAVGLEALVTTIGINAKLIAETVVAITSEILNATAELVPKFVEMIVTVIDEVLKAIADHADSIVDSIASIILSLLNKISEYLPEFIQAGINIAVGLIDGLAEGLANNAKRLKDALKRLFEIVVTNSDFDFKNLISGGGLFGGVLLLVVALKKVKLKPKDFARAAAVLAGCALLIIELGTFLALIGIAAEATNAAEHIKKFETFAKSINDVFGKNGAFTAVFGVLVAGIMAFAIFLDKIKKKLEINNKTILANIFFAATMIGETIGLAVLLLGLIGTEMAGIGALADSWNLDAGIEGFKTLADAVASIFTGPGGIALLALIAAIGVAGVFLEKIEDAAGADGALELAGHIGQAALIIGEIIGSAVLLISLLGAAFAGIGTLVNGIGVEEVKASIGAFSEYISAIADFLIGEGGLTLLGFVAAITLIGIFLEKIETLAGAKGAAELAGHIAQAALIIGELIALAVGIVSVFGAMIGGIGAIINGIGVEEVKASIGAFNEFVNAILGLFYTTGENGQLGEPNGPVITMFTGLLAVVSALALVIGLTNMDLGSMSAALWQAVIVIVEMIAAIAVIVGVMGLLFSAVGGLFILIEKIPFIGEGGVVAGIQMFGDVMAAIGEALGRFVGSLVGGAVEGFVSAAIPALADSLEYFAEHTRGFFEMIGELYDSGGLEAVGAFAAAILALTAASIIDGIGDWLGCGVDDFADNLEYFAEHAGGFFELMKSLGGGEALNGAAMFADIVLKLTAASILDGLTGWLNGKASFTDFVEDLKEMMPAFADFVNNMPVIDEDTIANAKGIGEVLAIFAGAEVPKTGGLVQLIVGEKDFGKFGTRIAEFGKGLKDFQDNTKGVEKDAIDKAATAAGVMIELSKELPSTGGLWQLIKGEKNFKKFGERLKSFGESLMEFQEATKDVDPGLISKAAICSKALVEINKALPNEGGVVSWFTGDNTFESFGKNLESFGTSLASYAESLDSIKNWDSISDATLEIKTILAVVKDIAYIGQIKDRLKITDFGSQLKSFGASFKEYYDKIKDIDYDRTYKVSDSVAKIVTILGQEIPANSSNWFTLMNKNPMFMKTFGENLYSLSDYIVKYYERISTVDEGSLALLNKTIEPLLAMITDNIVGIERLNQGTVNRFGKALTTFGGFYLEFYNRIKDIDEQKANALSDALTETIAAFLWIDDQYLLDKINGVGKQVMDGILFLFGAEEIKRDSYAAADTLVSYLVSRFEDVETTDNISFAFFKMILDALSDQTLYEDMKDCGADIADTIAEGIAERMEAEPDGLKGQLVAKLREIAVALEELEMDYINAGRFLGNSMVKGITDDKILSAASDAGVNFSKGLANGIRQGQNDVNNAAKVVTSDLVKETKKGLDEHSPSDVAADIGLFYDKGLELGLLNGMDGIKEKVDMVIGLIKNGTYDGLSDSEIWDRVKDLGIDVGSVFGDGIYDWINSGDGIESIGNFIGEEFTDGLSEWLNGEGIDGFMESLTGEFSIGLEDIGTLSYDGGFSALESYDSGLQDYFDSGNLQSTMTDVFGTVNDAFSDGITSNFENGELAVQSYGDGLISGVEAVIPQAEAAGEAIRRAFNKYALFGVGDTFGYLYEEMMKMPDGTTSTSMVYDFDTLKMEQAELESYLLDYFNALGNDEKTAEIISLGKEGHGKFAYFLDYLRAHPDAYGRAELVESWEEPITVKNGVASVSDTQLQYTAAEMTKTEIATNDRLMEVLLQTNGHLVGIREDISGVRSEVEQLERMNVVMDTGTLVGVLTPHIDEDLNNRSVMAGRSVIG